VLGALEFQVPGLGSEDWDFKRSFLGKFLGNFSEIFSRIR